jgi:hypothetical protein
MKKKRLDKHAVDQNILYQKVKFVKENLSALDSGD